MHGCCDTAVVVSQAFKDLVTCMRKYGVLNTPYFFDVYIAGLGRYKTHMFEKVQFESAFIDAIPTCPNNCVYMMCMDT